MFWWLWADIVYFALNNTIGRKFDSYYLKAFENLISFWKNVSQRAVHQNALHKSAPLSVLPNLVTDTLFTQFPKLESCKASEITASLLNMHAIKDKSSLKKTSYVTIKSISSLPNQHYYPSCLSYFNNLLTGYFFLQPF